MSAQPKLLAGKVVVFTGALSMTRAEATAMAERSGATVVSSVTKDTNVVVVGSGSGSKLDKAVAKGIEVWSEADFIRKMTVEEHQERLVENKGRVIEATGKNKFQFSLAWDALVDLDIHCKTPSGEVYFANRVVDGVTLDVDRMPDYGATAWRVRPVENIVAEKLTPGNYEVTVKYYSDRGVKGAVPYTVHYRVGDVENVFRGTLKKSGDVDSILKFKVDSARNLIVDGATAAPASAGADAPKKPAAKRPAAKAAAKKAPKKTAAKKKPAAKKPAAKKAPAKKKTPAKKTAAKKKPATKKPAAKKTAAKKKAPAKKKPATKKDAKKARPTAAKAKPTARK